MIKNSHNFDIDFNKIIRTMEYLASYRANKPNEAFGVCSRAVVLLLLICC